jgi:hypothetical protein
MLAVADHRPGCRRLETTLAQGLRVWRVRLFVVRIGVSTVRFAQVDRNYTTASRARSCPARQPNLRAGRPALPQPLGSDAHGSSGSMAIVRREAFVNGQWSMPGAQLLPIKYAPAKGLPKDPTQILRPVWCRAPRTGASKVRSLIFPRNAFDFVWMIDARPIAGRISPISSRSGAARRSGALYRVVGSATAASETADRQGRAGPPNSVRRRTVFRAVG